MDFQNRAGSKPGAGAPQSSAHASADRKDRLRKLAMETMDLSKDPYILRNNVGSYECKLCLTLHPNEANYLAHSQGRRHQTALARRAARDAANQPGVVPAAALQQQQAAAAAAARQKAAARHTIKIGRPGYQVIKQQDPETGARSLIFAIEYPEISKDLVPRHRFRSAFEQRVEVPDKRFQYLLFAAEPYETIAFKIPSRPLNKGEGKFSTRWDMKTMTFHLQLVYQTDEEIERHERMLQNRSAPRVAVRYDGAS